MATLQDVLLTPENKPHVIDDCLTLIDQEVKGKSGISGTAVKLAYKTANTFASGYLRGTLAQGAKQSRSNRIVVRNVAVANTRRE